MFLSAPEQNSEVSDECEVSERFWPTYITSEVNITNNVLTLNDSLLLRPGGGGGDKVSSTNMYSY